MASLITQRVNTLPSPLHSGIITLLFPLYNQLLQHHRKRDFLFFFVALITHLQNPLGKSLCSSCKFFFASTLQYNNIISFNYFRKLLQTSLQALWQFFFARFFFPFVGKTFAGSWQVLAGPASVCQCLAS